MFETRSWWPRWPGSNFPNIARRSPRHREADTPPSNDTWKFLAMIGSYRAGIPAALFAAFAWSLNFVVPFVIGGYSVFDFALIRFGVSGVIGLCLLIPERQALRQLALGDWAVVAWLAFIGYVGYFLTVTGAALYCGPVIAPAFLGVVPVVLAITGNLTQRAVPWRHLALPLALVALGLLLANSTALTAQGLRSARSLWIGIPLASMAVASWVWFAMANEAALAARSAMPSRLWTALTLVGCGAQMVALLPIGLAIGLFEFPSWGSAGVWRRRSIRGERRWPSWPRLEACGRGMSPRATCLSRWRPNSSFPKQPSVSLAASLSMAGGPPFRKRWA